MESYLYRRQTYTTGYLLGRFVPSGRFLVNSLSRPTFPPSTLLAGWKLILEVSKSFSLLTRQPYPSPVNRHNTWTNMKIYLKRKAACRHTHTVETYIWTLFYRVLFISQANTHSRLPLLPWLLCSRLSTKYYFSSPYTISISLSPYRPASWAAVLDRLSLGMCIWRRPCFHLPFSCFFHLISSFSLRLVDSFIFPHETLYLYAMQYWFSLNANQTAQGKQTTYEYRGGRQRGDSNR